MTRAIGISIGTGDSKKIADKIPSTILIAKPKNNLKDVLRMINWLLI